MPHQAPNPCTNEAKRQGCTCYVPSALAIDPYPDPKIDEWCPLHGRDPDWEREKRQDQP